MATHLIEEAIRPAENDDPKRRGRAGTMIS
jgi:hypothetical protein